MAADKTKRSKLKPLNISCTVQNAKRGCTVSCGAARWPAPTSAAVAGHAKQILLTDSSPQDGSLRMQLYLKALKQEMIRHHFGTSRSIRKP